jgi:hypothetical protein
MSGCHIDESGFEYWTKDDCQKFTGLIKCSQKFKNLEAIRKALQTALLIGPAPNPNPASS